MVVRKSKKDEVEESQNIDDGTGQNVDNKEGIFNEDNLVVDIKLPSLGLPYGIKDSILMRPMKTTEEKYFSSMAAASTPHRILTQVLKTITNLPIDPFDLLIDDRLYLLFMTRAITYTPIYRVPFDCNNPQCGAKFFHSYNIMEAPVKYLDKNKVTYEETLPLCKKRVIIKRMKGRDEMALSEFERTLERTRNKMASNDLEGDESYIYRLALQIEKVDGKPVSLIESQQFVKTLYGRDSLFLRNTIDEELLGISLDLEVQCTKCGTISERILPMTAEFFRPKNVS